MDIINYPEDIINMFSVGMKYIGSSPANRNLFNFNTNSPILEDKRANLF